jgi:hypothetical protein
MLGNVTVDACAAYQSSWADSGDLCLEDEVVEFLECYQNRHSSNQRPNLAATLTEEETAGIVALHLYVVEPLVRNYAGWTLANFTGKTEEMTEDAQAHEPLSKTEETRLLRASYRFQLCCNLFRDSRHIKLQFQSRFSFAQIDILRLFFCLFEPWEVEEIACI